MWKVWSSLTKLLLTSSCWLRFVFSGTDVIATALMRQVLLKQHTFTYMHVRECVSPECSLCVQELYTGGKDCNILAWVPVLRSPDMEEESNGTNKVGNRITCFRDDCEPGGCIDCICYSVLNCYAPMTDIRSQPGRVISDISTMTPQCFPARSTMLVGVVTFLHSRCTFEVTGGFQSGSRLNFWNLHRTACIIGHQNNFPFFPVYDCNDVSNSRCVNSTCVVFTGCYRTIFSKSCFSGCMEQ